MNVKSTNPRGRGRVHAPNRDTSVPFPLCRTWRPDSKATFAFTSDPVDCSNCVQVLNTVTDGDEPVISATMGSETPTAEPEGNNMTDTQEVDAIRAEVELTIERVHGIAEAGSDAPEDVERAKNLAKRAELLIDELPIGERVAYRKRLLDAQKAQDNAVKRVVTGPTTKATIDYTTVPEAVKLVETSAKTVERAVKAHLKASTVSREVARHMIQLRLCLRNTEGLPDLQATSQGAKFAARAVYQKVADQLDRDNPDHEGALKSVVRSVQNVMTDEILKFVRSLDEKPDEARKIFGAILESAPEDRPISEIIREAYNLPEKSRQEKQLEARAAARELEGAQSEAQSEAQSDPTERIADTIGKAEQLVVTATKAVRKLDPDKRAEAKARIDAFVTRLVEVSKELAD